VGLPDTGALRRVPGLRREEVAQLTAISVDYYTRLEQARLPGSVSVLAISIRSNESSSSLCSSPAIHRASLSPLWQMALRSCCRDSRGRWGHARSAVGVAALPPGSPVEIEAIVEVKP
jgi:hypothetical protein